MKKERLLHWKGSGKVKSGIIYICLEIREIALIYQLQLPSSPCPLTGGHRVITCLHETPGDFPWDSDLKIKHKDAE